MASAKTILPTLAIGLMTVGLIARPAAGDQVTPEETSEDLLVPERRINQARTSTGHILTPAAANIPGIGFFYGFIGGLFNLLETETDAFTYRFWGEMQGGGLGFTDIGLWHEDVTLNLFYNVFDKARVEIYPRGIHSSKKDRKIKDLKFFDATLAQINWRIFERRLQLNAGINKQRESISGYLASDGSEIFPGYEKSTSTVNLSYGTILDLTDDRSDPRKGALFEVFRYDKPRPTHHEAWYYNLDFNVLGYIPVLNHSTMVFNAYRSDAVVRGRGEQDLERVKEYLNLNCDQELSPEKTAHCKHHADLWVQDQLAANGHGTAIPVGGTQRMQAFPTNRYTAAHSQTFGAEFRLNLTQEFSPFNIGILSGIRTGLQLAAFYEVGTVTDHIGDLYKPDDYRNSWGGGVRLLLASGFVIRMDYATGHEGSQPVLIFQYPWNVF